MMGGEKVIISEEDYKNLKGKSGLVHIKSCNTTINLSSVSVIQEVKYDWEARRLQKQGFLHDGTPVLRQFGEWVDATSPLDDNGHRMIKLDPQYYPETIRDCVATPEEWEQIKDLPKSERYEIMMSRGIELKRLNTGFSKIGEVLTIGL